MQIMMMNSSAEKLKPNFPTRMLLSKQPFDVDLMNNLYKPLKSRHTFMHFMHRVGGGCKCTHQQVSMLMKIVAV